MWQSKKKRLLNIIIGFALVILAFSVLTLWNRHKAESLYVSMAQAKAAQENTTESTLDPTEVSSSFPLSASYTYKENKSTEWLSINPLFMGWIRIPETKVDYPFVRSQDNKDYLYKDFNNEFSEAGTIFMDYRNLGNFNDRHSILYGHNMRNGTMFHALRYYDDIRFFQDHPVIEFSGLYETKQYRVFSVYEISADDYSLPVAFSDQEYADYLKKLNSKSMHPSGVELNPKLRLLTLTTCSYGVDNGRFILHALEYEPQ